MPAARSGSGLLASIVSLVLLAPAATARAQPIASAIAGLEPHADAGGARVRKSDSLANGALIGALVGAGSAAPIFFDNECRDDPACYRALAAYAGIGALAGLGIDALVRDSVVVATPAAPRPRPLTVAPIVGRTRKGVRLTLVLGRQD